ncbi:glycosyltransferase family 4 protein [Nocardia sp. NPDC049526]|uniref:glycosyltransferase family 4 protein n=1 Tax=Nocardia sp. NPDC049526 TaxID=3364316 RepID=UPI003791D963
MVQIIVHISDVFAPRIGGIERQLDSLARAQVSAGGDVHVITSTPSAAADTAPYRVHRVAKSRSVVRETLIRLRPHVVHVHLSVYSPFAIASVKTALYLGIPTVITVHSMWDAPVRAVYRGVAGIGGWRDRVVVTAVSAVVAGQLSRALPGIGNTVLANGITASAACRVARADAAVHIVSVGRIVSRRQPLLLLNVLRRTHSRLFGQVPVRATVVGDGPLLPMVRSYVRAHAMDEWVELAGTRSEAGVREVLATADVYLNVAAREAFGLATLEARAAGVPIVARTGTGVADFIDHGRSGLLAASRTELVDALAELCTDAPLRDRFAAHNRSAGLADYSWPVLLERLQRCYNLAEHRCAAPESQVYRLDGPFDAIPDGEIA